MNLVELIKSQITSQVAGQLGSLLGGNTTETKSAVEAAVPVLLAALAGKAAGGGADKLAAAISQFGSETPGRDLAALADQPREVLEQGSSMLSSLLGTGTLSGIVSALARSMNFDSGTITKLLGYLAPFVLGAIAGQFKGKSLTGQGLSQLFADQKHNILDSLPSGLSLAGIPGLPDISSMGRSAVNTAQRAAETAPQAGAALAKNLFPIGALALLAALAWWFLRQPTPAEPPVTAAVTPARTEQTVQRPISPSPQALADATQLGTDLAGVYKSATETLTFITDEASAAAAAPKLEELNTTLDSLQKAWDKLPEGARSAVTAVTGEHLGKLKDLIQTVLAVPGVKEKIGPTLDGIVTKLTAMGG